MTTYPVSGCPHIIKDAHEYERALLRMVELTLANPRAGSADAVELQVLSERTRRYESVLFPFPIHPRSGDVCHCQVHCAGAACGCFCHTPEVV